jgi:hypothetical protein
MAPGASNIAAFVCLANPRVTTVTIAASAATDVFFDFMVLMQNLEIESMDLRGAGP